MTTWYDDDYDDDYDEWDYDEKDWENEPCGPAKCGECWGGDGICMAEIEALVHQQEEFEKRHVSHNVGCPHCAALLTQYQIPTTELWVWPGEWPGEDYYSPMIALDIFAVYGAPKGEVHPPVNGRFYRFHHIWVGEGEYRRESLIMLNLPTEQTKDPTGRIWPNEAIALRGESENT